MALVGINPVRGRNKPSKLEKIAQGVSIASNVLGTALAVPRFLQDREQGRQRIELAETRNKLIGERTKTQRAATDVAEGKTFRPATQEEQSQGLGFYLPESRVFQETPVMLRGKPEGMSDFDKKMFDTYTKEFRIAKPDETPEFTTTFGDKKVGFVAREKEEQSEQAERADKLRKEFLKESSDFKDQTAAYRRIIDSAKEPSAAGDLALIFNYMKVLDPGSTVREGEFANAQNSGGVPDRVRATYNNLMQGERLSSVQRKDFVNRSGRLYAGAKNLHSNREKFYSDLAEARDLNPGDVIPDIGMEVQTNQQPSVSDQEAEEF